MQYTIKFKKYRLCLYLKCEINDISLTSTSEILRLFINLIAYFISSKLFYMSVILNHNSISSSGSSKVLPWMRINTNTGLLTIQAPSVSSDSNFYFYIASSVSGISMPVQKLIKLIVTKCQVQNWQMCSSLNVSIWSTWSSDYTLKSGFWIIASDTSQTLRTTIISTLGASLFIVTIVSFMNPASTASLWSMINQAQLLLLLLLTRAFIPLDVQNVILGAKFSLNIASYFDFYKIELIGSIVREFNFKLSNQSLDLLGIKSDSSIYNISPVIILALLIIPIHLLILLLYQLMPTEVSEGRWKWVKRISIKFVNKLFIILTFGWYIRYIFEINQYVLISWINEVYNFTTSDPKRIASLLFSIFVFWMCLCLIICVSLLSISSYEVIKNKHNKVGEIFSGVKMMKKSKLFISILLTRRTIFIIFLITFQSIQSWILVTILGVLQIWYLIYIIILRPFEVKKNNIIEIVNEVFFSILLNSLIFLNSEGDWNSTLTEVYMWIIISNTIVILIIIICKYYCVITIVDSLITLIRLAKNGWVEPLNNGMWIITKLDHEFFIKYDCKYWQDKQFATEINFSVFYTI